MVVVALIAVVFFMNDGKPAPISTEIGNSSEQISWQEAVSYIENCSVSFVGQAHSLNITLKMKNGKTFSAKEPSIDDVFELVNQNINKCGNIGLATE